MIEVNSKYGAVEIHTDNIEEAAMSQVIQMANSPLGENANIRIMPDCHAGAGCVIGTTMLITDKVCPNIVGVDIGCGVTLAKYAIPSGGWDKVKKDLDIFICHAIPHGKEVHECEYSFPFENMYCWDSLDRNVQMRAKYSLGTLGGGNHFIEAYKNGYLSVHSGSRNIGYKVAAFYQKMTGSSNPLAYLTGQEMNMYLHDMDIMQKFAAKNRKAILHQIATRFCARILTQLDSVHNYIEMDTKILRKGAISAKDNEQLVIPLNMRDGVLICKGKGNPDWNYSAPHGAGRLYSRSAAKRTFSIEDYQESMKGIYTTSVDTSTIDEAPFAYKDYKEIIQYIEPTVNIIEHIWPIYNFKSSE